jgi:hypothetical protein
MAQGVACRSAGLYYCRVGESRDPGRQWDGDASSPMKPGMESGSLGACPSNPSLRGEGDVCRCEAAGSKKKPEAYSLEYVEDFFWPRTTQMPADRLPQWNGITRTGS